MKTTFRKVSVRKGFGFGLTSGIITTIGLIVGLHASTNSASVVLGGIIVIAIADALSDSMGIHVSEEFENRHTTKEIWESTISTFLSKFIVAITFIVPVLLLPLYTAIIVSIIWGLLLISLFSYYMAYKEKVKTYKVVVEHLVITAFVIIVTHYIGLWVANFI